MSDFTAQWANRHDGECERERVTKNLLRIWSQRSDYSFGIPYRQMATDAAKVIDFCHCYRRWVENGLREAIHLLRLWHESWQQGDEGDDLDAPTGAFLRSMGPSTRERKGSRDE